jgi:proteasome alpha subunit
MGGQAEDIRRFLRDNYRENLPLPEALQLGVRALTVTQNKSLSEKDLEVAVLDRTRVRRTFRRINADQLGQLLAAGR